MQKTSRKRTCYAVVMRALMGLAAGLSAALALFLVIYVLAKGLPNLSWRLLSTAPSYLTGEIGILPDLLNTLYIVLATLVVVLPLGVGAAVYLTEYATNRRLIAAIEYAAETLSGIPSIIYGLVGMLFFCQFLGMQTSLLAVEPRVLLMDEPTSALDPISTSKIEELAVQLKEQYTIVIVTHNMQQAVRISDRTAFFLLGELIECDGTEKLFSAPSDKRTEDYITGRFG